MIKSEYEKDFQTFAQHGCQNWRKSYIPKKKKKKKIEHILQSFCLQSLKVFLQSHKCVITDFDEKA